MALLNPFHYIQISETDVLAIFPSAKEYLMDTETTITQEITQSLCQIYDELRLHYKGVYTEDEISTLRDHEKSKPIERKVCYLTVANVLLSHGHPEQSALYKAKADALVLSDVAFSVDDVIADTEKTGEVVPNVRFGR